MLAERWNACVRYGLCMPHYGLRTLRREPMERLLLLTQGPYSRDV